MSEHVRGDVGKCSIFEQLLPELRKSNKRLSFDGPLKDKAVDLLDALRIEKVNDRQTNRSHGLPFFAVDQTDTATVLIDLLPFQVNRFASTTSSQRQKANDPYRHLELLVGAILLKKFSEQPIFVLGQPSVLYTICRFANAVRGILLDIALIDCIGEHPAKKPDRPCSSTEPTLHNRFATFLVGLLDHRSL